MPFAAFYTHPPLNTIKSIQSLIKSVRYHSKFEKKSSEEHAFRLRHLLLWQLPILKYWFTSLLLHFQSSFLLITHLGKQQITAQVLSLCHQHGKPWLISWLLASDWPPSCCFSHLRGDQQIEDFSLLFKKRPLSYINLLFWTSADQAKKQNGITHAKIPHYYIETKISTWPSKKFPNTVISVGMMMELPLSISYTKKDDLKSSGINQFAILFFWLLVFAFQKKSNYEMMPTKIFKPHCCNFEVGKHPSSFPNLEYNNIN